MTNRGRRAQKGFTLIEIILVIVILSIAAVPLFGQFSRSGLSTLTNEEIQTAAQLAQERAEHLFAVRRNRGYSDPELSVASFVEDLNTTNYPRYTRTTTITDPFAGNGCPIGAPCKQVVVQVTDDASGSVRSEITFVLVSY
jgi:prepilin-type N-terminal cleavage/methylation domain-containing protein